MGYSQQGHSMPAQPFPNRPPEWWYTENFTSLCNIAAEVHVLKHQGMISTSKIHWPYPHWQTLASFWNTCIFRAKICNSSRVKLAFTYAKNDENLRWSAGDLTQNNPVVNARIACRVCLCQCAWDSGGTTDDSVDDVTVFCRVACVTTVVELLSDVDIFASDASVSGKFGGVTGVFDGVRICTFHTSKTEKKK